MIVVATADFEVYHGVVQALRDRNVEFTTIEADDPLPDRTSLAIVGPEESVDAPADVPIVTADPETPRRAVEDALARLRSGDGRTIVGIDPGERPGIAVLTGGVVVAAFQVPAQEAAEVVAREVEDAIDPVVRIGDGARLVGARIIDDIDAPIELVDETGTTPYLGAGARGMGDVLAAANIARMEGEPVDSRDVEPTAGEIQRIKDRSREESETNRAIDEALARRVAVGELSIEEALAEHRGEE
ncbi:hypothetical protein [Halapricum hydrolyticum]|uniref:Uncharacterized protein n=1 Tax=Halapricum hydrolyticum TaxID=2979991 RepID=A0AAE3LF91_9EURY|nr:hypothetical protein [Halapricum hydrolyticum]MCU4717930.1 hypothetical protein [Halapricum hydrolyticum]MCU4727095.1 hypothetical protein [Halapricum hydrolyticum]